jgi:hypothetical protein
VDDDDDEEEEGGVVEEFYDDSADDDDDETGLNEDELADWFHYHGGFVEFLQHRVDEEGWAVREDTDVEGDIDVESSDGFIDDEEVTRMRSGVGDVGSEEEEEERGEPERWARGINLRAREDWREEEGSSLDEGSDVGSDYGIGWDGDEIRRSPPHLRRSSRVVTARTFIESESEDSESRSRSVSPPRRRSSRLRLVEEDSVDEDEDEQVFWRYEER